jgi:flagellar basal-body rod protein FlgB
MSLIEDPSSRLLGALLDAAALRARVLAGNVANQNTPGYTRQVVRFEELLRSAIEGGRAAEAVDRTAPEVVADTDTPARADGNNVNLELELSAARENRLLYEMYSAIKASRAELIRSAIESGR